jgi:hypothetical protein
MFLAAKSSFAVFAPLRFNCPAFPVQNTLDFVAKLPFVKRET